MSRDFCDTKNLIDQCFVKIDDKIHIDHSVLKEVLHELAMQNDSLLRENQSLWDLVLGRD